MKIVYTVVQVFNTFKKGYVCVKFLRLRDHDTYEKALEDVETMLSDHSNKFEYAIIKSYKN